MGDAASASEQRSEQVRSFPIISIGCDGVHLTFTSCASMHFCSPTERDRELERGGRIGQDLIDIGVGILGHTVSSAGSIR